MVVKHNAGLMEHNLEHNRQISATMSITSAITVTKSRANLFWMVK